MTAKRLVSLALAILVAALGNACSQDTSTKEMPAVNDENCKPENVAKLDKPMREQFASLCLRRNPSFTPSKKKEW